MEVISRILVTCGQYENARQVHVSPELNWAVLVDSKMGLEEVAEFIKSVPH
ncbi:hypothetical protein TRICI_000300 [Trichomonascus ciferrii]|uniref:Uncharacterized protein n=1 Tax=Trichomonascus ciferrii TaxID=44093 RepID=A0A642VDR1_9ASCO|nr:hypothetical protein TRICI_000300 [Trichomonascus ciferrii]